MTLPISFDFLSNSDSPSRASLNSGLTAGSAEGLNTTNTQPKDYSKLEKVDLIIVLKNLTIVLIHFKWRFRNDERNYSASHNLQIISKNLC
jgi:hypothetical protein